MKNQEHCEIFKLVKSYHPGREALCHQPHNLWLPLCSVPASQASSLPFPAPRRVLPQDICTGWAQHPSLFPPGRSLAATPSPSSHLSFCIVYPVCSLHPSSPIRLSQPQRPFQAGQLLSVLSTPKLLYPAEALIVQRGLTLMRRFYIVEYITHIGTVEYITHRIPWPRW